MNALSNIIEYDFTGTMIDNLTVVGHNDGLRYNPLDNELWALQNEDGNATLITINLKNKKQTTYPLGTEKNGTGPGPHGGGYDDIDFLNKAVYISASAPTIAPDSAPAIASLEIKGKTASLTGIINENATVTDVITGEPVTLALTDPDSMIVDPLGELVMTSQGDGELIVVQYPGLKCQKGLVVPLTSEAGGSTPGNTQLDDTVFTNQSTGMLLVADKGLNTVYAITAPYFALSAYSAVSAFATPTAPNPLASFVGPDQSHHRIRNADCQWHVEPRRHGFHTVTTAIRPGEIHQSLGADPGNLPRRLRAPRSRKVERGRERNPAKGSVAIFTYRVSGEFQFRRQLESEINRCNLAARNMNEVWPSAAAMRR